MATGNCWTLWQRLPPRYQLSTQEMVAEEVEMKEVMGSRSGSPRSSRSRASSPRYSSANQDLAGLTFGGFPPHTDERLRSLLDRRKLAFPLRNSRYISNMKTQQRVNYAKQQITSDPSIVTYVPNMRPKMMPAFPVTKLSNLQRASTETREYTTDDRNTFYQVKQPGQYSHRVLAVHNIFPFDDSKSIARTCSDQGKRYIVNDMDDATMFIDNGKVTYFKKTKPNMNQSVVNAIGPYSAKSDEGSYIAHLRKTYLKNPRDMAKTNKGGEADVKQEQVQQERCDYDKRVGHILDYYSHADEKTKNASDTDRRTPVSRQRSGSPRGRLRSPSPRGARLRSLLSTPVPQTPPTSRGVQHHPLDQLEEWSLYFKLNQRSILHEKQFYLKTPGIRVLIPGVQNVTPGDVASCRCRLCRVEMELSVLAQMSQMGIGVQTPVKSPSEPKLIVADEDCPGRPNSASVENSGEVPKEDVPAVPQVPTGDSVDKAPKVPNEALTIKLPEILEERESSDVSITATNRTMTDRKVEDGVTQPNSETQCVERCLTDNETQTENLVQDSAP